MKALYSVFPALTNSRRWHLTPVLLPGKPHGVTKQETLKGNTKREGGEVDHPFFLPVPISACLSSCQSSRVGTESEAERTDLGPVGEVSLDSTPITFKSLLKSFKIRARTLLLLKTQALTMK